MYVCMYVRMYVRTYVPFLRNRILSCEEEANFSRVINAQGILGNQESFLLLVGRKKMQETWEEN